MLATLNLQNALNRKLPSSIAWDTWRLDHLRIVENNVYLGREADQSDKDDDLDADLIDLAIADTRTCRAEAPASNA